MKPTLYIMCGLSFSGKTSLAKQLAGFLEATVLSYDHDIWTVFKPTLPKDITKTDEWVFIETKAREHIAKLLQAGKNVIFDDLSVEVRDRDALRKTASENGANSIVVYMDTPIEEVIRRQKTNSITQERDVTSDENMRLVISQLQPPTTDEVAVTIRPDYVVSDVIAEIHALNRS